MPNETYEQLVNNLIGRYTHQEEKLQSTVAQTELVRGDLRKLEKTVADMDENSEKRAKRNGQTIDRIEAQLDRLDSRLSKVDSLYELLLEHFPPKHPTTGQPQIQIQSSDAEPGSPSVTGESDHAIASDESEMEIRSARHSSDTFGETPKPYSLTPRSCA
ncbi:hypothetical protein FRC08_010892 [Ceratobasidium sp. 394]|nr:hypothetical protein FRC08_010892 [Ceratobasidium sp. 394]KAG9086119.1 hypothetical protein FS749_003898 [Ceratobasidium sp. UAMH 11750]